MKSGSLNLLEPSGPVQDCNGIALASKHKGLLRQPQKLIRNNVNATDSTNEECKCPTTRQYNDVSLPHSLLPDHLAHPTACPMITKTRRPEVWISLFISRACRRWGCVRINLHFPILLQGILLARGEAFRPISASSASFTWSTQVSICYRVVWK